MRNPTQDRPASQRSQEGTTYPADMERERQEPASSGDKKPRPDADKDMTTRPSQMKNDEPIDSPTTARQPKADPNPGSAAASGDPTQ